jgi:hypothetical protein
MDYEATPHHNRHRNVSGRADVLDDKTFMLMMTPKSRITGIVSELERLLANRQALVHRLETLDPPEQEGIAVTRAELATRLGQLIARQTTLLDELAALRPPANRTGS